jgi:hypothetical protein
VKRPKKHDDGFSAAFPKGIWTFPHRQVFKTIITPITPEHNPKFDGFAPVPSSSPRSNPNLCEVPFLNSTTLLR